MPAKDKIIWYDGFTVTSHGREVKYDQDFLGVWKFIAGEHNICRATGHAMDKGSKGFVIRSHDNTIVLCEEHIQEMNDSI